MCMCVYACVCSNIYWIQSLSCVRVCDLMGCSTPGFPVYHQLLELIQTHVHWVSDAIQPSHPLSSPFLPAFNFSQHQGFSKEFFASVQFSWVTQLCLTLCDPMDSSTPSLLVHHQLPEFTQTHVHWVGDAIQPSHPLLSPSPPIFNLSQHQASGSFPMSQFFA